MDLTLRSTRCACHMRCGHIHSCHAEPNTSTGRMSSRRSREEAVRTICAGGRPANEPRVALAANNVRAGEEHQIAVLRLIKAHRAAQAHHPLSAQRSHFRSMLHRTAAVCPRSLLWNNAPSYLSSNAGLPQESSHHRQG